MNGKRFMIGGWVVILGMHQHLQSMEKWPPQEHENKQVAPSNNNQVAVCRDMRPAQTTKYMIMSDAELQQRAYPLSPRSFLRLETLKAQLAGQDQSAKNKAEQELDGIINADENRSLACVASKIRAREHIQNAQYAQAERLLENKEFQAHDPEVSYLKALIQLGDKKREDALNLLAEASQPYTVQGVGENIKHVIYKPVQDLYKQLSSNENVIWQKDIAQWAQVTLDGNSLVRFTPAVRLATFKNAAAGENPQALKNFLDYVKGLKVPVLQKHSQLIRSTMDIFKAQATENPQIAYDLSIVYGTGIPGVIEIDQKKKEELFQLALQKNHAQALFEAKSAESKPRWYEFLGKTGSEKDNQEVAELRKKVWRMLNEQGSKNLLGAYDAAYAHLHYDEGDKRKGVAFFQAAHKMELEADDDVAETDLRKRAFQAMKSLAKENNEAREVLFDSICSLLEREKCFETHESDLATACALYENMRLLKADRVDDAKRLASLHMGDAKKLLKNAEVGNQLSSLRQAEKLLSRVTALCPDDAQPALLLAKILLMKLDERNKHELKTVSALLKKYTIPQLPLSSILGCMSIIHSTPFLAFVQKDMPDLDNALKEHFSQAPSDVLWLRFLIKNATMQSANEKQEYTVTEVARFQMSEKEALEKIEKAQLSDQEKKYAQALFYYLYDENQKADTFFDLLEPRFKNNLMPFKIVEKLKKGEACKDLFDAYLTHVQKENGEPFTKSFFSEKPLSDSLLGCKYLLMQLDELLKNHDNNKDGGNLVMSKLHLNRILSSFQAPQADFVRAHDFFQTLEEIFKGSQEPTGFFLQALVQAQDVLDFAQKFASHNPLYQVIYMHLQFYSLNNKLEKIRLQGQIDFGAYQKEVNGCMRGLTSGIGKLSDIASGFAQQIKSGQHLKFFKVSEKKLSRNDQLKLLEKINDDSPSRATILLYIEQLALSLKPKNNVIILNEADEKKIVDWTIKAAKISDDDKLFVGELFSGQAVLKLSGKTIMTELKPVLGRKMLRELSEKGNGQASERLANFYTADPKKFATAIELYQKAFEQGFTRAHSEAAGACYKKQDYKKALDFLQLRKDDDTFVRLHKILMLAHFYKDGLGTEKSDEKCASFVAEYYLKRLGMSAEKLKSISIEDEAKLKEIIDKNNLNARIDDLKNNNHQIAKLAHAYRKLSILQALPVMPERTEGQIALNKDFARLALETTIPDDLRRDIPIAMLLTLLDGTAAGAVNALEKLYELLRDTSPQKIKDAPDFLPDVEKKIYEVAKNTCTPADEQMLKKASALIEKINERVDEVQKLINQEKEVDQNSNNNNNNNNASTDHLTTKKSGKDEVL